MPERNFNLVSVIRAGKMTNVTKKTKARLVRNSEARKKLLFIIIKKALSSDFCCFGLS